MTRISVRPFAPSEWVQYRDTRLSALKDSPDAFASVFETTRQHPDSEWQRRLARILPDIDLPLAGLVDSEFAGMAWARFDNPETEEAQLYQMWVSPEYRGKGLSRMLLDTALEWAHLHGAKALLLDVTCGDTPARRLYHSSGFLPVGPLKQLRAGSDLMTQTMKYVFE